MSDAGSNILSLEEAVQWRKEMAEKGLKVAVTNGCFDLLHMGHASYLYEAAKQGDELWVLINSDASVSALKGPTRPLVPQIPRAYMLGALESVARVIVFDSPRCDRELAALEPDVYVKAGDYTLESLDAGERAALLKGDSQIVFMPFVEGFSTTNIVEKIRKSLQ
jgi:rfaE bifunctional protein nucleotidyltransferase chain/domain